MIEYSRKTVRLRRAGGSQSVVLPKAWLRRLGAEDQVDIVQTDAGIVIQPSKQEVSSIEDEPEFAHFLAFLAKDALSHPEELGDVGQLVQGNEKLFRDIEVE